MLPKRLPAIRPIARLSKPAVCTPALQQCRYASGAQYEPTSVADGLDDPGMNGGYVNPIPKKRALRDPYAGWWDVQERRNFGEPVHEDNDTLGVFSTEPYTHATPGKAGLHFGVFVSVFLGACFIVSRVYPDIPTVPREFPDGLSVELGGPGALLAPSSAVAALQDEQSQSASDAPTEDEQ